MGAIAVHLRERERLLRVLFLAIFADSFDNDGNRAQPSISGV